MDIFKRMGITVGNKPLIEEYTQKSEESYDVEAYAIRKGNGSSPRDVLEAQLAKGGISFRPLTDEEMCSPDDKKKAKIIDEHLKGSHGEEFHTDNDKQAEKLQTSGEVINPLFALEKPMVMEFKSMGVADALNSLMKSDHIEMPKKKFKEEHKKLVNVLNSPSKEDDKKEAKEQKKELDEMEDEDKSCSPARKSLSELDATLDDIISKGGRPIMSTRVSTVARKQPKDKIQMRQERQQRKELGVGKSERPEGVSQKEFDKLANLHENSEGVSEKKKEVAYKSQQNVVPFLKAVGPGGFMFDFGPLTGNPLADNATKILNENADPIQQSNANYNQTSFGKALTEYVTKGEHEYMKTATPYGNIDDQWSKQLNTPMDKQVKEAFEKGQLVDDNTKPAVINDFNKTEMTLGGQVIKATSETDAALIEMMRGSLAQDDGTGLVAEIGGGNSRVAEIS